MADNQRDAPGQPRTDQATDAHLPPSPPRGRRMAEHKLVIALPDEYDLDTTGNTIAMTVAQAREWAISILDATPPGTTLREQVEKRVRETEQTARDLEQIRREQDGMRAMWKVRTERAPLWVDDLARASGLLRKR